MDTPASAVQTTPLPGLMEEGLLVGVETSQDTEVVGSVDVDETIAVSGLVAHDSPDHQAETAMPHRTLSKREQWIMDVVSEPKTFRDTVLGYYIRGEFGFDKLPRKEILRLFQRHSYKLLTPEVSDALKQGLDDLVVEGVLIKKTYPQRTKKIRDTVYLHLSPTIEDELRELASVNGTAQTQETPAEAPVVSSFAWEDDTTEEETSTEHYDEAFERMLGPFKSSSAFKPKERGRRDERRRR